MPQWHQTDAALTLACGNRLEKEGILSDNTQPIVQELQLMEKPGESTGCNALPRVFLF